MNERLPGLTAAEADLLAHYVRILELLARVNPARTASTVLGCRASAQALVAEAEALLTALIVMQARGEEEIFNDVFARILRHVDTDRHLARLTLPD